MFPKIKAWDGKDLISGILTLKLDGVRCHYDGKVWFSRAGKPLHNLPAILGGSGKIYEYFKENWSTSVSDVRTNSLGTPCEHALAVENLYELWPNLDERLVIKPYSHMYDATAIKKMMHEHRAPGFEGFVWWSMDRTESIKIKVQETWDTVITDIQFGTGKYKGMLGAFITPLGKVGTGFDDEQRRSWGYSANLMIGCTIEVKGMGLTKEGKIRHPVFVRMREDK